MTRLWLLLILAIVVGRSHAADTIRLAVGLAKPPYIEAGGESGVEAELVLTALRHAGYQPQIVQVPPARALAMLGSGKVDAMLTLTPGLLNNVHYSGVVLHYRNRAIVRQGSGIVLTRLTDLARYHIAAFQNARLLFGNDYRQAVEQAPSYTEYADQDSENRMLLNRRVDVAIGDEMVFHANPTQHDLSGKAQAVTTFALFPSSPRHVGFRLDTQRRAFDTALKHMRANGEYARILQHYRDKYRLPQLGQD